MKQGSSHWLGNGQETSSRQAPGLYVFIHDITIPPYCETGEAPSIEKIWFIQKLLGTHIPRYLSLLVVDKGERDLQISDIHPR